MKRFSWWWSASIALVLAVSPALVDRAVAGEDGGRARKARKKDAGAKRKKPGAQRGMRGEYAIMAKYLGLDEAQTAKLAAVVEEGQKAQRAWMEGPSGQKYKELSEAAKKARQDKDKDKMKALSTEMRTLQKERSEAQAAQKADVMAILTDAQNWTSTSQSTPTRKKMTPSTGMTAATRSR